MNPTKIEGMARNIQLERGYTVFYINTTKVVFSQTNASLLNKLADRFVILHGEYDYQANIFYPSAISIPSFSSPLVYQQGYHTPTLPPQNQTEEEIIILPEQENHSTIFKIILFIIVISFVIIFQK